MPLKRNATDITHEKYIKDIRLQRFVERTLQINIECCFDVVHHIISDKGFREPHSYADAFTVLAELGVLILCRRSFCQTKMIVKSIYLP